MAKPIAYFAYSKVGLTVSFQNASLNSPESYVWDFGDGSQTSIQKNPIHTYSELGFFTVKLIVTNADGEDTLIQTIGASDVDDMLNASILELVLHFIPSGLLPEMTTTEKIALIRKWQLYLQPLVEIPYMVAVEDTYNEYKWPGLVNNLIAQLVAYDIIIQAANQFIASSTKISEGSINPGEPGEPIPPRKQQIKSIETGPAKTEWYEDKTSVEDSEAANNISQAIANSTKAGGALDQMQQNICQLASRVRIFLPICGQLEHSPIIPRVVGSCKDSGHNANPFGITKRMT